MPRCKAPEERAAEHTCNVCEQASDEATPQMGVFQLNHQKGRTYIFSGKLLDILMRGSVVPSTSLNCSMRACL